MPLTLPFQIVSKLGRNRVVAAPHQQNASSVRGTPPSLAASHVAPKYRRALDGKPDRGGGRERKSSQRNEQLGEYRRVLVQQRTLGRDGSEKHLGCIGRNASRQSEAAP